MNKYYLKVRGEESNTASLKAKIDIEKILSKNGYKKLYDTESKSRKLRFLLSAGKLVFKSESVIITQYPFITTGERKLFKRIKKYKDIKLISIIHDINSLRDIGNNEISKSEEIKIINENDCIISHNEYMTKWLKENGVTIPIINIEIFDYLNKETKRNVDLHEFKNVYFAGNLDENKSKFIYLEDMDKFNFTFKLYGPNYNTNSKCKNLKYEGCFSPEDLIDKFKSGFGLIWDGTSIDKCDGINGEYLRYNNPHKTSLYLSSGLPIIIWSKAALSDFIEKNKVGVKVDSLTEINEVLNNMSLKEYRILKENAEKLQRQLQNGKYTMDAVNRAMQIFERK